MVYYDECRARKSRGFTEDRLYKHCCAKSCAKKEVLETANTESSSVDSLLEKVHGTARDGMVIT